MNEKSHDTCCSENSEEQSLAKVGKVNKTKSKPAFPKIVSREEWLVARKELLVREKEVTRARDAVNAARRRLPMVELEKDYILEGTECKVRLHDLFEGRRQLFIHHFMFDPDWDAGCSTCTSFVNQLGQLTGLHDREITFALVSRAPQSKLEAYKQQMGWSIPWYSSYGSDFNYDFHVSLDEEADSVEYNYSKFYYKGEMPGLTVFLRDDDRVFHAYSAYARGTEQLSTLYNFLDLTPYGRQEDWEDSPVGWPQSPTYG